MSTHVPGGTPPRGDWVDDVLGFWFRELEETDWWKRNPVLDERIRRRFQALHERLAASGGSEPIGARAMLATVIVLDQFSRNLYRDSPRAFENDAVARALARRAVDTGLDAELAAAERLFLYLPFEHSEDRADQALSVELVSRLGREDWIRFAVAHQALIDRFGRFPHRNALLGRESTAEEIAAIQGPMGAF
jgi:uncharacterized protein (DUF924 family)